MTKRGIRLICSFTRFVVYSFIAMNLTAYLNAVDTEMRAAVRTDAPALQPFYDMLKYHLGWIDERFQPTHANSGKRLRPVFCLLACETLSGQFETALPAAVALELLHNFSLIHDDIEDGDERRRHRPTLWKLVGVPHAINAGDALFALAQQELLRLGEHAVATARVLRAAQLFQRMCVQLVEGQYLDMRAETLQGSDLATYKQMVSGKTAALLGAAMAIGAVVATDDAQMVKRFQEFGVELGLAYQMIDDILSLWGDPQKTGKPAGADLRKKKKSLPVILGLMQGGELSHALRQAFAPAKLSESDVERIMRLMDAAHIRAQAEREAEKHRHRASRNLKRIMAEGVASETAAQTLGELAESLTRRDF